MARKLKTYTTSAGFFDLAVAAPSMKAALDAWGSTSNLFHQGFAKQTHDPGIVAATMALPGRVLRRPVGGTGTFSEHAELPADFGAGTIERKPARPRAKPARPAKAVDDKAATAKAVDGKTARAASLAFEREQKRREARLLKEEAARRRERARRERTIAAARSALDEARRVHRSTVEEIEEARRALDRKLKEEEARWKKQEEKLEGTLDRARAPGHLRLV